MSYPPGQGPNHDAWDRLKLVMKLTPTQVSKLSLATLLSWAADEFAVLNRKQRAALTCKQLRDIRCINETNWQIATRKTDAILRDPYTKILARIKASRAKGYTGLGMEGWHRCDMTHCIGGWATILAPGGIKLERQTTTRIAATMILSRSRPDAPLPNLYLDNATAMRFIRARAREEAAKKTRCKASAN